MPRLPLYKGIHAPDTRPAAGNVGLWYTRFFHKFSDEKNWELSDQAKLAWVGTVAGKMDSSLRAPLQQYRQRQIALVDSLGGCWNVFKTTWHFATGLGLDHPIENGFAFHHALGVPYLAGSGVKGLLRAWFEVWAEDRPQDWETWFGDTACSGRLIFFDALPIEEVTLVADVMTPHCGGWYAEGHQAIDANRTPDKVPADWHDPVPVPFLVVAPGACFLFSVAPRKREDKAIAKEALIALAQALEWVGAGAKTAAGYGRFREDTNQRAALGEEGRKRSHSTVTSELSPLAQKIEQCKQRSAGQSPIDSLYHSIEEGLFTQEERPQAAAELRRLMVAAGRWREKPKGKADKNHEKTKKVMAWLGTGQQS